MPPASCSPVVITKHIVIPNLSDDIENCGFLRVFADYFWSQRTSWICSPRFRFVLLSDREHYKYRAACGLGSVWPNVSVIGIVLRNPSGCPHQWHSLCRTFHGGSFPVTDNREPHLYRFAADNWLFRQLKSSHRHPSSLINTGSFSEVMSIDTSGLHLMQLSAHDAPLKGNEQAGYPQNKKGCLGPTQSRTLESIHLALNLFEVLLGGWLLCRAAEWLGYLDFRRTLGGVSALVGGLGLVAHGGLSVTQKLLTCAEFSYYNISMANILPTEKTIAIIGSLCEGSSIRSIERLTGVHRDTIMRLGVKVGQGCTALLDSQMRNLSCERLEMDEIWGFVGKKERHIRPGDDQAHMGDVWTFCAIDADTKLVPSFKVGKRDGSTANAFVADVAGRMRNRLQISTDGLKAYVEAIEASFGADVDYAQIIKTYGNEEVSNNRRYSPQKFVSSEKHVVMGFPDVDLISTSYVERLNATTRLHMRRLTRLTLAFSKKWENFEAAVGLHFAYYNFVKRHNTLRMTPAMAAGVTGSFWSVGDLVEASA